MFKFVFDGCIEPERVDGDSETADERGVDMPGVLGGSALEMSFDHTGDTVAVGLVKFARRGDLDAVDVVFATVERGVSQGYMAHDVDTAFVFKKSEEVDYRSVVFVGRVDAAGCEQQGSLALVGKIWIGHSLLQLGVGVEGCGEVFHQVIRSRSIVFVEGEFIEGFGVSAR